MSCGTCKQAKGTVHPVTYHEGTEGFRILARLVIQSRSAFSITEKSLVLAGIRTPDCPASSKSTYRPAEIVT